MRIETFENNGVLVIRLQENRLDTNLVTDFKSKSAEFVKNGNVNLVINMSSVQFIDSSMLGTLISLLKEVGTHGEIKLCNLTKNVKLVFQMTHLDKIFGVFDSEKKAIDSFNT